MNQSVVLHEAKKVCDELVQKGCIYRATGVTLSNLYPVDMQYDLFGESVSNSRLLSMYKAIDDLSLKYGKNMLTYGTSFHKHIIPRKARTTFKELSLGLNISRFGLPFMGEVV